MVYPDLSDQGGVEFSEGKILLQITISEKGVKFDVLGVSWERSGAA